MDHYLDVASGLTTIDREQFLRYFHAYVLIRLIQVLGAYGFRGLYEKKPHFISSIPIAIRQLQDFLESVKLPVRLPELTRVLKELSQSKLFSDTSPEKEGLTVTITSFSFRRGVPFDHSGNGGGFVFDCRAIHNPGRFEPYKKLTGRDEAVIQFFREETNIHQFLETVFSIVDTSVDTYLNRNFTHLMVNFGCTGGAASFRLFSRSTCSPPV